MTNRELEILNLIKINPCISQNELSEILGIARSSVGVHITNLMKKGYIKGKGYIVKPDNYVIVIGGANIDIQGFPNNKLSNKDSNPGKIKLSLGGVGRNIAENISKLDINTKLISALGDDIYGEKILKESKLSNIDMDNCLMLKNESSSTYLCVLDEFRDMQVAISDMDIYEKIDIEFIRSKHHIISNANLIVVDTNIPKETLHYLVNTYKDIPFFLDTVSITKAEKVKDIIGLFHTIKPNIYELQMLCDMNINSEEELKKASDILLSKGVKNIFITLGDKGVYCVNFEESFMLESKKVEVVNATGAGDAFVAGLVYSYLNDYSLKTSAYFAMASSILAISHENTINPNINAKNVNKILKEMNFTC